VVKEIESAGGIAHAVTCDVADPVQVEALVAAAADRFGRVDILVNNAGTVADGGPMAERLADDVFEYVLRVNLLGTWYGCRAVAARMLADGKGGSIVNISSIFGLGAGPHTAIAYQASKAAVINLTKALALSWADRGVRVNALAPGWFPTDLNAPLLAVPAFRERVLDQEPMSRLGRHEELVGALLFLASDASSYVTGHTLVVDGGVSASLGASRYSDDLFEVFATAMPGLGERIMPEARVALGS
jgi:NAD(P)-dependent dehydrogenase (short-subunit alcohol dehydrogenase family)